LMQVTNEQVLKWRPWRISENGSCLAQYVFAIEDKYFL